MDIEKMKRINELARELKEQGMASDTEDAYKKAERMIEGTPEEPVISRSENSIINTTQQNNNPNFDKIPASGALNFDAIDKKGMLDRIEALEGQLNVMFGKMNEIISEINRIQTKRKDDSPIEIREEREDRKPKDSQSNLKKEEVHAHPRTGNYKPDDVSIEKMFYFGR